MNPKPQNRLLKKKEASASPATTSETLLAHQGLANPSAKGGAAKDQLLTVKRAVAILDYLQLQSAPVGLRQISTALNQSQTGVFRLVATLEGTGLVQRYDSPRGYALGWKIDVLANSHLKQLANIGPIREAVDALSAKSGQTAAAHMMSGLFSICVASREGGDALVYRIPVGRTSSLALGAAGKAILAYSDQEPAVVLRAAEGGLRGPKAEKTVDGLVGELQEIRRTGMALSFEELIRGVSSMAMPIFAGENASIIGSLSLSGPTFQWDTKEMSRYEALLRSLTSSVSKEFGCKMLPTKKKDSS
jgi:DNA-binding IclR family transcriptional regulator